MNQIIGIKITGYTFLKFIFQNNKDALSKFVKELNEGNDWEETDEYKHETVTDDLVFKALDSMESDDKNDTGTTNTDKSRLEKYGNFQQVFTNTIDSYYLKGLLPGSNVNMFTPSYEKDEDCHSSYCILGIKVNTIREGEEYFSGIENINKLYLNDTIHREIFDMGNFFIANKLCKVGNLKVFNNSNR